MQQQIQRHSVGDKVSFIATVRLSVLLEDVAANVLNGFAILAATVHHHVATNEIISILSFVILLIQHEKSIINYYAFKYSILMGFFKAWLKVLCKNIQFQLCLGYFSFA